MTSFLSVAAAAGVGAFLGHALHKRREAKERTDAPPSRLAVEAAPPRLSNPPTTPTRRYDRIFDEHGHGLPVAYLRALAYRESGLNPKATTGDARGLLQVVSAVRDFYNRRHGTRYRSADLFDPAINVRIASFAIATMIDAWAKRYPGVANLQPDWSNPEFVALVTFGWNAGWSDEAGVGRVVRHLVHEQNDRGPITVDRIHQLARRVPGATKHLSNPRKVAWAKSVVRLYLAERARDARTAAPVSSPA